MEPKDIRSAWAEAKSVRERDFVAQLNISEAELVAAHCGTTSTRIAADPDAVIAAATALGEVMALTRNEACVHEKTGLYQGYERGHHAAMVLAEEIDLRLSPRHWCHAFMVEKQDANGVRRSIQVFDAAGDAVHKVHLKARSNHGAWEHLRQELALPDQSDVATVEKRQPPEAPKPNPSRAAELRERWAKMVDPHQFMRLTSQLNMNRLGAYHNVGQPFCRALQPDQMAAALDAVKERELETMIFTGNQGCIQIHSGRIETLVPMGPSLNVMDPRFNLHLRTDKIAELWAVEKPTKRGTSTSIEAFDADGTVILQVLGRLSKGQENQAAWQSVVEDLKDANSEMETC